MHLSFDQCCDDVCDVCLDISGAKSVLMSTPDIATIIALGACPACSDYTTPVELVSLDQATTQVLLNQFATFGCNTDAGRVAGTECGYVVENTCGVLSNLVRFSCTYRTSGGLRMFNGVSQSWNDGLCSGSVRGSEDILLASGSYRFDCLTLDHDGTLTVCAGSLPLCGCSFPITYNVQFIAA